METVGLTLAYNALVRVKIDWPAQHDVLVDMKGRGRRIDLYFGFCLALGALLLVVNVIGMFVPMRAQMIDGYVDFAGSETLEASTTLARLSALKTSDLAVADFVREATKLFHDGIAHVDPEDVDRYGFAHFGMSVPVTENWVLYLLRYIKPGTYRDYEFCSYRKAVQRGTGRCGQQALALVSFLSEAGVRTGFVALGGHAIATAEVAPGSWHLLDPDYGGVIPFDIDWAASNTDSLLDYYWSDAARERNIHQAYLPDNEVKFGGPEARYGRACFIERWAYVAKWAVPSVLILGGLFLIVPRRFRTSPSGAQSR